MQLKYPEYWEFIDSSFADFSEKLFEEAHGL